MHCLADQPPCAAPLVGQTGCESVPVLGSDAGDLVAETRDVSGELVEDGADVAVAVPKPASSQVVQHRFKHRLVFGADAVQADRVRGIDVAHVTDIFGDTPNLGSGSLTAGGLGNGKSGVTNGGR